MIISYKCPKCKKKQEKEFLWINPKSMKDKPYMNSIFWCPNSYCKTQLQSRVKFLPNNTVKMSNPAETELSHFESKDLVISIKPKEKKQ